MLPQDDLTTSEHFRDQRHNKHFALCYNKAMPFAMFATDNWIFIWLALSKLSIIPWVRARENCLIVQLSKAGLGQTHSLHPSHPFPGAEKGVHRSLTIPVGPAGHWQFAPLLWADVPLYFSICFFLLESLNSVVKIHNWQGRIDEQKGRSTLHHLCNLRVTQLYHSSRLTPMQLHWFLATKMATPASASNTPI